jgi:RNA recognition motif-containing protein
MIKLFVGNLSYKTTGEDLNQLFSQLGEVTSASIVMDRETGRSRGFGFVEMPNREQGEAAISSLNEKEFQGRNITVNEARPKTEGGGGGGRRNFGGGGNRGGYDNNRY